MPIGPDTAREILRAVLALEATRMDAHVREALQTSIDTIRVAAQSANGVLASTDAVQTRPEPRTTPKPVLDPPPARRRRRPVGPLPRNPDPDTGASPTATSPESERPVFRRPRGR